MHFRKMKMAKKKLWEFFWSDQDQTKKIKKFFRSRTENDLIICGSPSLWLESYLSDGAKFENIEKRNF